MGKKKKVVRPSKSTSIQYQEAKKAESPEEPAGTKENQPENTGEIL